MENENQSQDKMMHVTVYQDDATTWNLGDVCFWLFGAALGYALFETLRAAATGVVITTFLCMASAVNQMNKKKD